MEIERLDHSSGLSTAERPMEIEARSFRFQKQVMLLPPCCAVTAASLGVDRDRGVDLDRGVSPRHEERHRGHDQS
jgi:hypothetical protein